MDRQQSSPPSGPASASTSLEQAQNDKSKTLAVEAKGEEEIMSPVEGLSSTTQSDGPVALASFNNPQLSVPMQKYHAMHGASRKGDGEAGASSEPSGAEGQAAHNSKPNGHYPVPTVVNEGSDGPCRSLDELLRVQKEGGKLTENEARHLYMGTTPPSSVSSWGYLGQEEGEEEMDGCQM
ncbi:hypothetical protein KEM55_004033 [Ascosphaera atra]|nr:hypothetical protein KEM55_004033 [Ascosphaera atra]